MSRNGCLLALFIAFVVGFGCKKTTVTVTAASGGPPLGGALTTDDSLGQEWIKTLNDYAEVIEKKGTGEQRRAASAKWQDAVKAIQALPRDRQLAIQQKFKSEIDSAEARYKKAREELDASRPKPGGDKENN